MRDQETGTARVHPHFQKHGRRSHQEERVEGCVDRLLEAQDGDQALALADRQRPQIVLLDVDIPGVDGIEVCRTLRGNPRTSEATIVMLTASHSDAIEARAEAAGADLFLTKPFSPLELLRLVDGLSGQSGDQG